MPSIASVSKLSLKTRTADTPEGLEILLEGGNIIEQRPAGMPVGTVMSVRDLFYNVPARKKFLKSPATEEAHIQEMVIALALGFPQVSVTLKFDNKIALQSFAANDPAARAAGVFGKAFAGKMLKVDYRDSDVEISGLIAAPGFTRTSRREQRTFVNGRAVESLTIYRGIRDGYGTLADFGRFPPTILDIKLDAGEYDINVHPTKREVRFKREYIVSRAVANAVRGALQTAPAPEINLPSDKRLARPEVLLDAASINYEVKPAAPEIPGLTGMPVFPEENIEKTLEKTAPAAFAVPERTVFPSAAAPAATAVKTVATPVPEIPAKAANTLPATEKTLKKPVEDAAAFSDALPKTPKFTDRNNPEDPVVEIPPVIQQTPLAKELADSGNMRYVGILFGTFVAVESLSNETLYLIDFHAAHERVLYEELLAKSQNTETVASQQLLLPPAIELSCTAAAFINKNEKLFSKLGFDAALLSSNTVLLNAVPANLPGDADWEKILTDLVSSALEGEKNTRDSLEAIARAACHAAVKANDPLNEITAKALLKSLQKCQRPDVCPHGRPTVLKMSKNELARRFGRI